MEQSNQIQIRARLEPGDIGYITYLHGTLYAQEFCWDYTFEGYVAAGLAQFALSFDANKDCIWIAEMDKLIVGSIAIVGQPHAVAQLRWFLVHPESRGKGLGRILINNALQFCRERDFKSVFLLTVSSLSAAAHLYQSAGFRKTEQQTHEIWGKVLTEERYDLSLTSE